MTEAYNSNRTNRTANQRLEKFCKALKSIKNVKIIQKEGIQIFSLATEKILEKEKSTFNLGVLKALLEDRRFDLFHDLDHFTKIIQTHLTSYKSLDHEEIFISMFSSSKCKGRCLNLKPSNVLLPIKNELVSTTAIKVLVQHQYENHQNEQTFFRNLLLDGDTCKAFSEGNLEPLCRFFLKYDFLWSDKMVMKLAMENQKLIQHFIQKHSTDLENFVTYGIQRKYLDKLIGAFKFDEFSRFFNSKRMLEDVRKYVMDKNSVSFSEEEIKFFLSLNHREITNSIVSKQKTSLGYESLKRCYERNWTIAFEILSKEKDIVEATNSSGDFILHDLMESKNINDLAFLLKMHPTLVLHKTITKENVIVEAINLISKSTNSNEEVIKTLFEITPKENLKDILLSARLRNDQQDDVFQLLAKNYKYHECLKFLLKNDILDIDFNKNRDSNGRSVMYHILKKANATSVELPMLLIKKGMTLNNVDGKENHLIDVCFNIGGGDIKCRERLFGEIMKKNRSLITSYRHKSSGRTILHYAKSFNLEFIQELVKHEPEEVCLSSIEDRQCKLPIHYVDKDRDDKFGLLFCRKESCWSIQLKILFKEHGQEILDDLGKNLCHVYH